MLRVIASRVVLKGATSILSSLKATLSLKKDNTYVGQEVGPISKLNLLAYDAATKSDATKPSQEKMTEPSQKNTPGSNQPSTSI